MILATHETLRVAHAGRTTFGPLYVILEGERTLHSGCLLYIRSKWRKLTGQIL